MREDFGKCVIESPRRGSRSENKHTRERVRPCDWERYQDAGRDQGWRRSMYFGARSARMAVNRRAIQGEKDFSDSLGPLEGYLRKMIGRPVNLCRSELRKVLGKSRPMLHILTEHFEYYFESVPPNRDRFPRQGFYADAQGRVQYRERKRYRLSVDDPKLAAKREAQMAERERTRHKPESCEKCREALREHNALKRLDRIREWREAIA